MELSSFSENVVTVPYDRNGETVNLDINIDAFTPEFFRLVGKRFEERMRDWKAVDDKTPKPKRRSKADSRGDEIDQADDAKDFFERQARELEIKRQIHAELLAGGVLKGWDVTENNIPIPPTVDVLLRLPPLLVENIWNLSLERAKTVKKRVDEGIEETSENMPSGSRVPLALAPTG